jgi:hypothetical protein
MTYSQWFYAFSTILILSLASCVGAANIGEIRTSLDTVTIEDGVTQPEALILAQNLMLDWGLDFDWYLNRYEFQENPMVNVDIPKHQFYEIKFQKVSDGYWPERRKNISILTSNLDFPIWPLFMHVNKETGKCTPFVLRGRTGENGGFVIGPVQWMGPDAEQKKWAEERLKRP